MMLSPKDNLLRAIRRQEPQWVPNGLENVVWLEPPILERPYQAGLDAFGVRWDLESGAGGGTFPAHGQAILSAVHRWRQEVRFPDPYHADWIALRQQAAQIDRQTNLVLGFVHMGLFERTYLLMGMEEALIAFLAEPEAVEELVAALADYKIQLIGEFHRQIPLDMVWYGDDWGTQDNLFLPPEVWRRIIKPHTQRVYDCMREHGLFINQHSCGKIESIVSDMVEMGVDIWNPCQPCNDLAGPKKKFGGQLCFAGGIDSQFVLDRPGVTPEEVRAEVRRRIDEMAPGGGYVAAPSHSVPYDKVLLDAMNDEIRTYGRAIYSRP